mmetsp:Transcript_10920/g.15737  ORF Transcript_10920/g.15737 Transcript_10920/m.15737 type:complete len:118 (-) Transcript_10920:1105-1458(-)
MLDGRWRLIYTTRPTPSVTVFGAVSGIYQVFDTSNRTVENRIEFSLLPNLPRSPAKTSVATTSKFETIDNSRLRLKITNLSIQLGNLVSICFSQCLGERIATKTLDLKHSICFRAHA